MLKESWQHMHPTSEGWSLQHTCIYTEDVPPSYWWCHRFVLHAPTAHLCPYCWCASSLPIACLIRTAHPHLYWWCASPYFIPSTVLHTLHCSAHSLYRVILVTDHVLQIITNVAAWSVEHELYWPQGRQKVMKSKVRNLSDDTSIT